MTAAIFCGLNKPDNNEKFLRPLVDELNTLISHGITIQGEHINISLRAIVADTTARAFIKGVAGHTGYDSCAKCTIVGEYSHIGHTVVFPTLNAPKRTHQGFQNNEYPGHNKKYCPLLELKHFDMVKDFVVSDPLHLFYLGIVKRLLIGWRDGNLGKKAWSLEQCEQISNVFAKIKLPSEMHRKLRSLKFLKFWKGVEFSYFLHYAGFVVLKSHLNDQMYSHFMLLFCAVTILSSTVYKDKWVLAGQLLDKFIQQYANIYGERYITSNVHNLHHVYDDVVRFGPLPSISTYPFENHLQVLKGMIRSGWKNLEQAINRISEKDDFNIPRTTSNMKYPAVTKRGNLITLRFRSNFLLQNNSRNGWFLTKDDCIFKFQTVVMDSLQTDNIHITGKKVNLTGLVFNDPFESSEIYTFKGFENTLSENCEDTILGNIRCKLVAIPTSRKEETIFVPLLHTLIE
ncbi:uncharacterized protein LOC125769051 [Anopheles funestus]|uniref:uncharacterized protein LOC125769051 n=1 Tax=Anopheles funestus TaxID=62324 RepID=UPI0020C62A23|nr:uncharacterized protein LOC125769051 [Anopheles funestus]